MKVYSRPHHVVARMSQILLIVMSTTCSDLSGYIPSQYTVLSHHRHASETPFKRRFAGWSMMSSRVATFLRHDLSSALWACEIVRTNIRTVDVKGDTIIFEIAAAFFLKKLDRAALILRRSTFP